MTFIGTAAKGIGGWLRFSNDIHRHSREGHGWLATRPYRPHLPFVSRFVANAAAILVKFEDGGRIRAILFDFRGPLNGPSHWVHRFLAHYHPRALRPSRNRMISAY